ncbi:hypothetical protein CHUAL_014195 [Chamberlinius hualienensis]
MRRPRHPPSSPSGSTGPGNKYCNILYIDFQCCPKVMAEKPFYYNVTKILLKTCIARC